MRPELEAAVGSAFFARNETPPDAAAGQWLSGCKIVQSALSLGLFPDAQAAIAEFAERAVLLVASGEKLGFALQQVRLSGPRSIAKLANTSPPKQLSAAAQAELGRWRDPSV